MHILLCLDFAAQLLCSVFMTIPSGRSTASTTSMSMTVRIVRLVLAQTIGLGAGLKEDIGIRL